MFVAGFGSGWRSLVEARHPCTRASWTRLWSAMHQGGFLVNDWNEDEHVLADVVHFVLYCRKTRASQNKTDAVGTRRALDALRDALATYLGTALDTYIVRVYLPCREDKPPPALISPRKDVASRRYVRVQPEAIWDLFSQSLARSRTCRAGSTRQHLSARRSGRQGSPSGTTATRPSRHSSQGNPCQRWSPLEWDRPPSGAGGVQETTGEGDRTTRCSRRVRPKNFVDCLALLLTAIHVCAEANTFVDREAVSPWRGETGKLGSCDPQCNFAKVFSS